MREAIDACFAAYEEDDGPELPRKLMTWELQMPSDGATGAATA